MEGVNFVRLKGFVRYPNLDSTQNGYPRYKARLGVPITYEKDGITKTIEVFHNISAWGAVAEGIGELSEGTPVEITGQLSTTSYNGKCRHCGGDEKKYWTEVKVDNFVVDIEGML